MTNHQCYRNEKIQMSFFSVRPHIQFYWKYAIGTKNYGKMRLTE